MFPRAYAINTVAAITDFLVYPATLAMPMVIIREVLGPKNPMMVYPTIGAAA